MRDRSLLCLVALGALGAAMTIGDSSEAAMVAFDGHALDPAETGCFAGNGFTTGVITNNCGGLRRYCVSDFVTSSGGHSVRIVGVRPSGGTVSCFANGVTESAVISTSSGVKTIGTVNQSTALSLGTVNVPGNGAIMVCCDLSQGATLQTVTF